ncbi:vWA domain-containing protein [Gordonia rhizosphera]|uniref:vWA domain-containing protein n=1 Tax=Gordonia rhizosphera TaxID=83341 RepID=UPI0002DA4592|nr:VWA domain-containing protein [Gordonia rhizosphera]
MDRAAFAAGFTDRLRSAGVPVGQADAAVFGRALGGLPRDVLSNRRGLYWVARITLVRKKSDIDTFDAVFAAVFDDAVFSLDPVAMRGSSSAPPGDQALPVPGSGDEGDDDTEGLPWATLPRMAVREDSTDDADGSPVWIPQPSAIEAIARIPFDQLDSRQLQRIEDWLDEAIEVWPRRRSRRERVVSGGRRIDLRHTLVRARHTGWEIADVAYRGPMWRQRRIVMICDVSQSMQAYTSVYLHVMRALSRRGRGETFAFATRLTRMTPILARSSIDDAVDSASEKVVDRFGGTRIAASLDELLRSRHAQTLRGAICVIASDGWDSDDPSEMDRVMARIARRAFTVIWLNPRAGVPGYLPLVGGMAAALPYCDRLLPAATVDDLASMITAITEARRR